VGIGKGRQDQRVEVRMKENFGSRGEGKWGGGKQGEVLNPLFCCS